MSKLVEKLRISVWGFIWNQNCIILRSSFKPYWIFWDCQAFLAYFVSERVRDTLLQHRCGAEDPAGVTCCDEDSFSQINFFILFRSVISYCKNVVTEKYCLLISSCKEFNWYHCFEKCLQEPFFLWSHVIWVSVCPSPNLSNFVFFFFPALCILWFRALYKCILFI